MMDELALIAEEMYAMSVDPMLEHHPTRRHFNQYARRIGVLVSEISRRLHSNAAKIEEQAFQLRKLENEVRDLKKELERKP